MKISLGDLKYLRRISEGYLRTIPAAPHKPDPRHWPDDRLTLSWLGHATVLINFFGVWILTDPALLSRIGVRVGPLTFGPKRYVAPALRASELPPLDFVILTHAHMDHLDIGTLRRLRRNVTVVTAEATADLLTPLRFREVVELGWGASRQFDTRHGDLSIEAFKVRHWGARMRNDVHRGFNGHILERQGRRICLAGDTALTSFTAVGRKPTDVIVVPIGAYNPGLPVTARPSRPWTWPIRLAPDLWSPSTIKRSVSAGSRWTNRFDGSGARFRQSGPPSRTLAIHSFFHARPVWTLHAGS